VQADASASSSIQGFTPSQISTAYGFNNIQLSNGDPGTGAGQTIAIVDAYNDPNIASDLSAFDSQFDLSAPPSFTVVSQSGSTTELPVTNASWDEEISLDVEWSHAMAPQANILLVETNSDNLNSLMAGVVYAADAPNVSVVSMSWGSTEFSGETAYDSDFLAPASHKGVTFVAASGDDGSYDGPNWPAVSPDVLSVGGTTLATTDSSGTYGGEIPWQDTTGGISSYEDEPTYQENVQTTDNRTSPDVAYDADPNTGVAVYDSVPYEGTSGWVELGGTSVGAPQWSSLVAIADQDRALSHIGSLSGATGTLPKLYDLANNSSTYAESFNTIVEPRFGYYDQALGYNLETGLGSPEAPGIINGLASGNAGERTTATVIPVSERPRIHFPIGYYGESQSGVVVIVTGGPTQTWQNTTSQTTQAAGSDITQTGPTTTMSTVTQHSPQQVAVAGAPIGAQYQASFRPLGVMESTAAENQPSVSVTPQNYSDFLPQPTAYESANLPAISALAAAHSSPFRDGPAIGSTRAANLSDPPITAKRSDRTLSPWFVPDWANLDLSPSAMPLSFLSNHLLPLNAPTAGLLSSAAEWTEASVAAIAAGLWLIVYCQGRRRGADKPPAELAMSLLPMY
ncbi:MAG TPA: S53 family peptidase, partial [Tepidisphaeraceae bacterium]|nr:S53 family peptidase [Tepidisphaeraceae bacterium]